MNQKALLVLFAAEALERFAYFALVTTFVLFLVERRGMSTQTALSLYGTFAGLSYLLPLLGGFLADSVFGQARAVMLGALLLGLGYATLLIDSGPSLYAAIFILALGHGLFKPSAPATVANLYERGDVRRENAFIIFFLGIQIGAFIAPLCAGFVRHRFGWAGVALLCIFAMTTAALLLAASRSLLENATRKNVAATEKKAPGSALAIIYLIWILHASTAAAYVTSLPLFVRDHVELSLGRFNFAVPMHYTFVCESLFQVLLAPVVIGVFLFLRSRKIEPSIIGKIGIGMVLMTLPCLLMAKASLTAGADMRVSFLWVAGGYLASALPNLFLMPLIMSTVSQLVPGRMLATTFSVWLFLNGVSTWGAARLGMARVYLSDSIFYGALALLSLLAAGLWISQVRRLESALGVLSNRSAK